MKLTRLFQPRHPKFWLLLALNALSALISWLVQTRELAMPVQLILASFAIGNLVLGMRLAWQLMQEPERQAP